MGLLSQKEVFFHTSISSGCLLGERENVAVWEKRVWPAFHVFCEVGTAGGAVHSSVTRGVSVQDGASRLGVVSLRSGSV